MPVCDEVTVTVVPPAPAAPERIRVVRVDVSAPSEVVSGEEFEVSVAIELEQEPPSGAVYTAGMVIYVDGSVYGSQAVELGSRYSTVSVRMVLHAAGAEPESHSIRVCLDDYAYLRGGGGGGGKR